MFIVLCRQRTFSQGKGSIMLIARPWIVRKGREQSSPRGQAYTLLCIFLEEGKSLYVKMWFYQKSSAIISMHAHQPCTDSNNGSGAWGRQVRAQILPFCWALGIFFEAILFKHVFFCQKMFIWTLCNQTMTLMRRAQKARLINLL